MSIYGKAFLFVGLLIGTAFGQCTSLGSNLVSRGDFEGNTNTTRGTFTTDYTWTTTDLTPEGNYSILNDPNALHSAFQCPCTTPCPYVTCASFSCRTGRFMAVNGATASQIVWRQTVNVTATKYYIFKMDFDNLIPCNVNLTDPLLTVQINGVNLATDIQVPESPDAWNTLTCYWQAPAGVTIAQITIKNRSTDATGNDFGIDNISFQLCNGTISAPPCNTILPVELKSFDAYPMLDRPNVVKLFWETASEHENKGFWVERRYAGQSEYKVLDWIEGTNRSANYAYTDNTVSEKTVYYRLRQVDYDGVHKYSNEVEAIVDFNGKFGFALTGDSKLMAYGFDSAHKATVYAFDILGREITSFVVQESGTVNGVDFSVLPKGVIILRWIDSMSGAELFWRLMK